MLIRHSMAEESSQTGQDRDRPLSEMGRDYFSRFCEKLSFLDLSFQLLLESYLLRSQQTADIFCKYFSVEGREKSHKLDPLAEPNDLLLELSAYDLKTIVIVGHQPFLTRFINFCLTADDKTFIIFKRGAMAFLEFPLSVQSGSAQLKCLLDPKYFVKK